jgi:ferrous iron transport protein A
VSLINTLDRLRSGQKAKIVEVTGGWGLRQKLSELGILPGQVVTIANSSFWRGPVRVQIHSNCIALGRGVASKVRVEVIP